MWDACNICGTFGCLCNCDEALDMISKDLKEIHKILIKELRHEREKAGIQRDYVGPEFLTALRCQGAERSLLRALAVEIPESIVHEAFLAGEISEEETTEIHRLCDEAKAPWITRWWRDLWSDE